MYSALASIAEVFKSSLMKFILWHCVFRKKHRAWWESLDFEAAYITVGNTGPIPMNQDVMSSFQ